MNILVILVYSFLSIFAGVRVVLSLFSYNSVGGNIIPLDFLVRSKNQAKLFAVSNFQYWFNGDKVQ